MNTNFTIHRFSIGLYRVEHNGYALTGLLRVNFKPSDLGITTPFTERIIREVEEYLEGKREYFSIAIDYSDVTPFRAKVYDALTKIPYGETRSYKEIAIEIGNPKAARAVGMANNRNPIHIVIPCHRVVGANGSLTGYAAGVDVKEQLLKLEGGK